MRLIAIFVSVSGLIVTQLRWAAYEYYVVANCNYGIKFGDDFDILDRIGWSLPWFGILAAQFCTRKYVATTFFKVVDAFCIAFALLYIAFAIYALPDSSSIACDRTDAVDYWLADTFIFYPCFTLLALVLFSGAAITYMKQDWDRFLNGNGPIHKI